MRGHDTHLQRGNLALVDDDPVEARADELLSTAQGVFELLDHLIAPDCDQELGEPQHSDDFRFDGHASSSALLVAALSTTSKHAEAARAELAWRIKLAAEAKAAELIADEER